MKAKSKPYVISANSTFDSSNTNNILAINPSLVTPDIKQFKTQRMDHHESYDAKQDIRTLFETLADMKTEFNLLVMYKFYSVL